MTITLTVMTVIVAMMKQLRYYQHQQHQQHFKNYSHESRKRYLGGGGGGNVSTGFTMNAVMEKMSENGIDDNNNMSRSRTFASYADHINDRLLETGVLCGDDDENDNYDQ
jgi:hypothetical protein